MIEFALVLPVLILIIIGILELSLLFYDRDVITNASREGARYGIVLRTPTYATSTDIVNYTKTYTTNKLITFSSIPSLVTVTATPSTSPQKFGDTLTVTVTYTYTDLVLHHFINHGQQYNLSASTKMTYE